MRQSALYLVFFIVLVAILAAGFHALTRDNNLGTDFYTFWLAGRAAFIDHKSPYSEEIAIQGQLAIFKHLAGANEDQLAFAYPPYALLPLYPLIWMPFDWAQAAWIALLLLGLVTAFALAYPRSPRWVGTSFLAFYPVFFGVILGNFAILIAALLVILFGVYLPRQHPSTSWQILAGIAAGWLTIKPQLTWPFLALICLYEIRVKRWKFFAAMIASLLVFFSLSFLFAPNWPVEWPDRVNRYMAYNQTWLTILFLLKQVIPLSTATLLTTSLGILFIGMTVWLVLRWWHGKTGWLVLVAWMGFCGYLFHPHSTSYEQIAFLLPLVLWVCSQPNPLPRPALSWWLASLVVSWLAFILSIAPFGIESATEWPVLFHVGWIGWLLTNKSLDIAIQV